MNWPLILSVSLMVLMLAALVAGVATTGKERPVPKRTSRATATARPRVGH